MRNALILGSGRSGTSMLAGTLAAAGAFVGDDPYPPRLANPKGFFETPEINGVNEDILARSLPREPRFQAGQRWLATLPLDARCASTPDIEQRIGRLIARAPYCFKDPRFCYTLPVWREHVKDALFLCVFRDPATTIASMLRECATEDYLKTLPMDFERALAVWKSMYEHVLRNHRFEGEWHFVHYDQMLTATGLDRLEKWIGAKIGRTFPDAALKRSRGERAVDAHARELYEELCHLAGHRAASLTATSFSPSFALEPREEPRPEISVILCTYNRAPILARSIASFARQVAAPGSFELVIVNDGSTDGTRDLLAGLALDIPHRIVQRENGGLAAARNSGIAQARGRLLLFVNDDTIAFPDLIGAHVRAHAQAKDPAVAVLGTFEQPAAALGGALMRTIDVSDLVFRFSDMRTGERYDHNRFWTCNISVAADAVRAAGGFDERFRQYGCEDIDLGIRLEERGMRVLYDTRARAHHDHILDYDALRHRQLTNAHSFIHLFAKHPRSLQNPDWKWLEGRTLIDLELYLAQRQPRLAALEAAARELSSIDCVPLDDADADIGRLSAEIVRALDLVLHELNAIWWQEGFAKGLRELDVSSFAELGASKARSTVAPIELTQLGREALDVLNDMRATVSAGELDLATIETIRCAARFAGMDLSSEPDTQSVYCDLLSDLSVLRFRAGDRGGSRACLDAVLAIDPTHADARANMDAIEASHEARSGRWGDGPDANALPTSLNPWVEQALGLGRKLVGFEGRQVLEVGGAVPAETALATGALTWTAGYLGVQAKREGRYEVRDMDARKLPFADASFDMIFSSCAFEHINEFDVALGEMQRVLRPSGALVTLFAPIWSCAVGHHLWELDGEGRRVMFLDPVIPRFGHLLLSEAEMYWYLKLVLGNDAARRCTHYVYHHPCINRVLEGDFQRMFRHSGFDASRLERQPAWYPEHVPSARLLAELRKLHPQGGDFATPGFQGVLIKTCVPNTLASMASLLLEGSPSSSEGSRSTNSGSWSTTGGVQ